MAAPRPSPADLVRQSSEMARRLADTARFHHEPGVALWFEQIAADGEARAEHLEEIVARLYRMAQRGARRPPARPGQSGDDAS